MLPPTRLKDSAQTHPLPVFLASAPARDLRMMQHNSEPPRAPSHDVLAAYTNASVIGVVVVDRNYDIIAINSAARAMLQIHGVGVGSDLIHLLPATGAKLRSMIDAALNGDAVEPSALLAKDPVTGIDRWLQIHCSSHRVSGVAAGDTVGVVIVDVTRYERHVAELQAVTVDLQSQVQDQMIRSEELSSRARSMLAANEELTAVNADLRTYNEQLLINAEEAASSNEEIETLNEEMQATNEELETLNEELQATVEELNTTNDELEARSTELEQANLTKQAQVEKANLQRVALSLVLNSYVPACAVVNAHGEIYYMNPKFSELASNDITHERWWRGSGAVTLSSGAQFKTTVRRLDGELFFVTFET
jgi:two-component system, chemotaxis family, CheB/CheR fusion protein